MARVQLVVSDEIAEELDQGVALSTIETRERQTRTSFIVRLVRAEVARLRKAQATAGKPSDSHR